MNPSSRNSKEVLEYHIEVLGEELGMIFNILYADILYLHLNWGEYECMFGDVSQENIDLMKTFRPSFFRVVQNSIFESVVLRICRLVDPETTMGKKNLSLFQLSRLVDSEISDNVNIKLEKIKEKSKSCIDWRNRWIAHKDLEVSLESSEKKLQHLSRNDINAILKELENLLEIMHNYYFQSSVLLINVKQSNGTKVLNAIRKGLNKSY